MTKDELKFVFKAFIALWPLSAIIAVIVIYAWIDSHV